MFVLFFYVLPSTVLKTNLPALLSKGQYLHLLGCEIALESIVLVVRCSYKFKPCIEKFTIHIF